MLYVVAFEYGSGPLFVLDCEKAWPVDILKGVVPPNNSSRSSQEHATGITNDNSLHLVASDCLNEPICTKFNITSIVHIPSSDCETWSQQKLTLISVKNDAELHLQKTSSTV